MTIAWLNTPDNEVCRMMCNFCMRGSLRISEVRVYPSISGISMSEIIIRNSSSGFLPSSTSLRR
ncbi:hypothetical protein D3C78_1938490 [compost metagenome]